MKRILLVLASLGLVLGYNACERQSWEESRVLHLKHDGGHDTDGEGHHAGEDGKNDHDGEGHDKDKKE